MVAKREEVRRERGWRWGGILVSQFSSYIPARKRVDWTEGGIGVLEKRDSLGLRGRKGTRDWNWRVLGIFS